VARSGYCLSDRAVLDLQEIADYLGERSESAADRVLDSLHDTFEAVAQDHGIGSSLDHYRPGLRMPLGLRPAHNYVVFYRVVDGQVLVPRVLHATRDWISSLADDE
jgi:plasmid stabilization system protein ParE